VGYFESSNLTISAEETVNKEKIVLTNGGNNDPFIIKYNPEGLVEWADIPYEISWDNLNTIDITENNEYIACGYIGNGVNYNIPGDKTTNGQNITINGNTVYIQYNTGGKI